MPDTVKLKALAKKMFSQVGGSRDQAFYMDEIGKLAEKNLEKQYLTPKEKRTWRSTLGQYYGNKATLIVNTDPTAALALMDKALQLHVENNEQNQIGFTWVSKGMVYMRLKDYTASVESYFQALKYFDNKPRGKSGQAYAHTAIANIYKLQKDFPNALVYYNKAMAYTEGIKDPPVSKKTDLAEIYSGIAGVYHDMGKNNDAENYYDKAVNIAREINDKNLLSAYLVRLGSIYFKNKDYTKARAKYEEALDSNPSDLYKSSIYNSFGELYIAQKKFELAEDYLNKAAAIIKKVDEKDLKQRNSKLFYKLYKESKEYDKSLEAYESYVEMDTSDIDESKILLKEQAMNYEFEKKQLLAKMSQQKKLNDINTANAEERARKNMMLYIAIGVAVLLLAGVAFLYYFFKQKNIINANKNNELKRKLLLTQMNPHFIFNSVDNIQSLIYLDKNDEAINYLTKFSKLTRQILEYSTENHIPLSEEINMIANYLVIQQLLYSNNFEYTITTDDAIDPERMLIPPMLTQPFIENAVKHGLKHKKEGGRIDIRFSLEGKALFFEVTDNGTGLDGTNNGHKSLSTQIVNERLMRDTGRVSIERANIMQDGTVAGVKIKLEIPYIY